MAWEVRTCASREEVRRALRPIFHYFGRNAPTDDQFEPLGRLLPPERVYAAWDGGHAVAGASAFPFELTVPGGRIRAAGVSTVAVLPTHRRQGILTAIMRAQLEACHQSGEAVAYLWATEDRIYGRFGYGIGSFTGEIDVVRERAAYVEPFERAGEARLVPLDEAEAFVAPIYERVAVETPGMFTRSSTWWQARPLADPEWRRGGGGELQCALLELGEAGSAYALYRLNLAWDRGIQTGHVGVVEAMGDSPAATRAIWRFLFDVDWMDRVRAVFLPVDHPLLLMVAEPRRLRFSVRDGLWVRLVDVSAALSARAYGSRGSVVIEVADEFCPWNQGRWRVSGDGVKRTDESADLRCDVTALGSVYLGGFTWSQLARASRVEVIQPLAVARADALFRSDRAPWCPEVF